MTGNRIRPSKPHAVLIAVLCSAMVVFGVVQFVRGGEFHWFFVLWVAIGVFIVAAALFQAFRGKGLAGRPPAGGFAVRPSKPMAVIGAVMGVGMMVVGGLNIRGPFVFLWLAAVAAIIVFNLWSAFGRDGATSIVERRD